MKVRSLFWLLVLGSIFASALYVSSRAGGAQPPFQGRTVKRLPVERNEPVRIRAVKVKALKVVHGQTFLADEEWLRGLTITITNRTTKTIVLRLLISDSRDRETRMLRSRLICLSTAIERC